MENQFSPKEITVFEGVMRLVMQGEPFFALKVQQIADAACMGKGTLYEYFSSREEILARALLYVMWKEIDALEAVIASKKGFQNKFSAALDFAHDSMKTHETAFSLVNSAMHEEGMAAALCKHEAARCRMMERMYTVLDSAIQEGIREGSVAADITPAYGRMAASGMLFTATALLGVQTDAEWQETKANALTILCKALS